MFLADCRWLADVLGERKTKYVTDSSIVGDHIAYEDSVILVECAIRDGAMTVRGKGQDEGGLLKHSNPVVMINGDGRMYRWHGEARFLFDHVRNMVRVPPIPTSDTPGAPGSRSGS